MRFSVYYYRPFDLYGRADFMDRSAANAFAKRMARRGYRVRVRLAESA